MPHTLVVLSLLILFVSVFASNKLYISMHLDTNTSENSDIIVFYIISKIGIVECIEDCKSRKRCQFVNYITRSTTCFLLSTNDGVSISAATALTKLTYRPGFLFGIKQEWDLDDKDVCETCPDIGHCSYGNANETSLVSSTCITSGCYDPYQQKATVVGTQYIPGNWVKYVCNTGYIGTIYTTNTAKCQQNGTWSPTNFTCIYDCGTLMIANGKFTAASGTTEMMTATLSCDVGYILSGNSLVTCTESGWDGSATCSLIDCGTPTLDNGQVTVTFGTTFGMSVTLYCNPGYAISGDTLITCTESGWDGSTTCTYIDCGNPTPQYGTADSTVYTFGSVITITCNPGLAVTGNSVITCQADGTWSDSPTCGCASGQQLYGTSCYKVITQHKTWNEAKSNCESIGGHLVDVNSNGEQQFVVTLMQANDNSESHWIGGNDKSREGVFRWSDNTRLSSGYTNWHSSQPDESRGGEDCVDIIPGSPFYYTWNDNVCTYSFPAICEIDF